MENYNTNAIEKLVNEIADSYDYPDEKLVSQMNELTGRSWSAKDCWEYTCEYWSHNSLHETVYALINGDYPPYNENEYYVWNAKRALEDIISVSEAVSDVLEETHLFFRLGRYKKNRKAFQMFNSLPVVEIYQYFKDTFAEWNADERDSLSLSSEEEYGIKKEILIFPYEDKCLRISFTNVNQEDIDKCLDYLKKLSTDIFHGR